MTNYASIASNIYISVEQVAKLQALNFTSMTSQCKTLRDQLYTYSVVNFFKLFEIPARHLYHTIVQAWLEARCCGVCDRVP